MNDIMKHDLYMKTEKPTSRKQQLMYRKTMVEDELHRLAKKKTELLAELVEINMEMKNV